MKKLLIMVLALTLFSVSNIVSAEKYPETLSTVGTIEKIENNTIKISGQGLHKEIVLHINEETYLLNGELGFTVKQSDIKQGMTVIAYYSPKTTRSIPPQSNAKAIIIGDQNIGRYFKVDEVLNVNDGVKLLNDNKDLYITVTKDIFPYPSQIKKGDEMLLWYDKIAKSYPAQGHALKAIKLFKETPDLNVHLTAGVIVVKDVGELPIDQNNSPIAKEETVLLPLRIIMENMGYDVLWNNEKQSVEMTKKDTTVSLKINSNIYTKNAETFELENPATIINGNTFVPIEFFSDILGQSTIIMDGHV